MHEANLPAAVERIHDFVDSFRRIANGSVENSFFAPPAFRFPPTRSSVGVHPWNRCVMRVQRIDAQDSQQFDRVTSTGHMPYYGLKRGDALLHACVENDESGEEPL